jgi:ribosomal protein S14
MKDHVFAPDSQRCLRCGVLFGASLALGLCPGVPQDDEAIAFDPPLDCYDPELGRCTLQDEVPEDPDQRPGGNLLCPVCSSRPCLVGCRLGLSREDLDELAKKWEATEHA